MDKFLEQALSHGLNKENIINQNYNIPEVIVSKRPVENILLSEKKAAAV